MDKILNLTQHTATPEQSAVGVVEPVNKELVCKLLTFDTLPSQEEIDDRARQLVQVALKEVPAGSSVMLGGALFLMGPLVSRLKAYQRKPVFAFSQRQSQDMPQADGTVKKVAVFKHVGFIDG